MDGICPVEMCDGSGVVEQDGGMFGEILDEFPCPCTYEESDTSG